MNAWIVYNIAAQLFPFNSLPNNKNLLTCCSNTHGNTMLQKDLAIDHNSSLLLKPSPNLKLLVNHFNNATPENSNDPENISSFKYYDIDEMHNIEIPHKNKCLFLFHINAYPFINRHMKMKKP